VHLLLLVHGTAGGGIDAVITLSSDREDDHVKRVMRDKLG
jgi:hypothetical protein